MDKIKIHKVICSRINKRKSRIYIFRWSLILTCISLGMMIMDYDDDDDGGGGGGGGDDDLA
jgi:hypothetical protein